MPAKGECSSAITTAGTPAIKPPTKGMSATRATQTPISTAKGTPRIARVMAITTPKSTESPIVPRT